MTRSALPQDDILPFGQPDVEPISWMDPAYETVPAFPLGRFLIAGALAIATVAAGVCFLLVEGLP